MHSTPRTWGHRGWQPRRRCCLIFCVCLFTYFPLWICHPQCGSHDRRSKGVRIFKDSIESLPGSSSPLRIKIIAHPSLLSLHPLSCWFGQIILWEKLFCSSQCLLRSYVGNQGKWGHWEISGCFSTLRTLESLADTELGTDFFLLGRARRLGGLRTGVRICLSSTVSVFSALCPQDSCVPTPSHPANGSKTLDNLPRVCPSSW